MSLGRLGLLRSEQQWGAPCAPVAVLREASMLPEMVCGGQSRSCVVRLENLNSPLSVLGSSRQAEIRKKRGCQTEGDLGREGEREGLKGVKERE